MSLSPRPMFSLAISLPRILAVLQRYPRLCLSLTETKERLSLRRREADITIGMVRPVGP